MNELVVRAGGVALVLLAACAGGERTAVAPLDDVRQAMPSDPALGGDAVEVDEGLSLVAYTQQPPRRLELGDDAHEQALHRVQRDPALAPLRDALRSSGASAAQIREALTAATYFRSGIPGRDPGYEQWRRARDYLDDTVLQTMDAIEAEEVVRGVTVDRALLEEWTRLPSLAERARSRQEPIAPPPQIPASEGRGCTTVDCAGAPGTLDRRGAAR